MTQEGIHFIVSDQLHVSNILPPGADNGVTTRGGQWGQIYIVYISSTHESNFRFILSTKSLFSFDFGSAAANRRTACTPA
jgi:hypothetical protein